MGRIEVHQNKHFVWVSFPITELAVFCGKMSEVAWSSILHAQLRELGLDIVANLSLVLYCLHAVL